MAENIYVLNEEDRKLLNKLLKDARNKPQTEPGPTKGVSTSFANSFVAKIPTGGIAGVGTAACASVIVGTASCEIFQINKATGAMSASAASNQTVYNIGKANVGTDECYRPITLTRHGEWLVDPVQSPTGTCSGLIDPDDCWIGCRGNLVGTGSGLDNTIFHKIPFVGTAIADCATTVYLPIDAAGSLDVCWAAFDHAGHLYGYYSYTSSWVSYWGFAEPAGP